jgi:hypothetical protein
MRPVTTHRTSLFVVPGYLGLTLLLTWPLVRGFASDLSSVYGPADSLLQIFLIGWDWQALTSHPLAIFHAPIFYPEPRTLTYMDSMIGEAFVAGPLSVFFGPAAGYNALVLLSFVMSGWMLYRLARFYGLSRSGSFLAGFFFAFCPYRFSNLGLLNQLQTQFIPMALLFAARFMRTGAYRFGLAAALVVVVQAYFGWYGTFHLGVAVFLLALWELGQGHRVSWKRIVALSTLTGLLVLPLAMPYWQEHHTLPEFRRTVGESALWSADLLDYLQLNQENVLAKAFPFLGDAQGYFPGLMSLILAVFGFRALRNARLPALSSGRFRWFRAIKRWGEKGYFVLLGSAGLVLSLGPVLQIANRWVWIPLPFAVCFFVIPGFSSMRAPGRFAVLVALAVAALAGMGFDTLRRRRPNTAPILFVGLLLGGIALAWCPDIPFVPAPDRASMPPVYAWLAQEPGSDPVLELPMPGSVREEDATHARRQFWVLYHKKPRLDGVSGFVSNSYEQFRARMADFPAPPTIQLASEWGARSLIVHYEDYPPARRRQIREQLSASPQLEERASFGLDVVYKIRNRS